MRILALDLGTRMGVADGDSSLFGKSHFGECPHIEAVTLRGTSAEKRARFLGEWLHEKLCHWKSEGPSEQLIITEAPMNPAASKSADATIYQLHLHGTLQGVSAIFDVDVALAPVMAVRKHFCGMAHAPAVCGHKRTSKEAIEARKFINEAVLRRAILLGYLPEGSTGWDEANSCALWDYGCAKFARSIPSELTMYGEPA